jgi:DNA-binding transcriptional MocR family regulator
MGQNPTSGVLSLERRRELYALCSKYDIIIAEDDPYWYLQYPSSTARLPKTNKNTRPSDWKSSGYDFLDSLVPSYLNIDTDGRVIRMDTFSKTVAPGCRLGWLTTQPAFVERLLRLTETSTQQPSGFVQSVIAELIMGPQSSTDPGKGGAANGAGWKADGWIRWLEGLRGNYERRMNTMSTILEDGSEIVKSGRRNSLSDVLSASSLDENESDDWAVVEKTKMYSFDWPVGGMFLWCHMHFENHPLAGKIDGPKLSRAMWIFWTTKPYLVLVSPGTIFSPTDEIREKSGWQYFRLCFAACDDEDLAPISHRFVEGVNAFWRIKSVKKIEELLAEDEQSLEQQAGDLSLASQMARMTGPC